EEPIRLKLTSKWGFDASSRHVTFKQKSTERTSEGSVVLTSFVPLELSLEKILPFSGCDLQTQVEKTQILWMNIAPSSTRFCRPISFHFQKETDDFIAENYEKIEAAIQALKDTKVGDYIFISHQLVPSMFDGKICPVLTGTTASSRCEVCNAVPCQMNDLKVLKKLKINVETYRFGLSPLHARIRNIIWLSLYSGVRLSLRCLEFILNLAYRLDIQTWRACSTEHKQSVAERKKMIQETYRQENRLLLDCVQQGFGTTNDGNTSRRFFEEVQMAARVTGVCEKLIERSSRILKVLSCGRIISVTAFRKYSLDT
ncbi:hypothetical protein FOCC_FOCC013703, partial [Frankliniella occidentalis]